MLFAASAETAAIRRNLSAVFQRVLDHFAHELSPTRFEKEQFRFRSHPGALWRKLQKLADRFADRRSARFTGD